MIAIKDMEMPRACTEVIETQNEKGWVDSSIKNCPLYNVCKHRETIKTNYKPTDCPLLETEERKHGKWEHDKLFGECAYVCSFCHTIWTSSEIENMHYCPTCGAEMRN